MTPSSLKHDLHAGFSVFLLALPLCLGIAMASNFPPVAGIITAIIGGLISSFFGSSRLTIKGPAAGLIVIVLGAVTELGAGDITLGYKRALAVGVVAAVIQIFFALTRVGKLGEVMPPSVVHGMLAAIGVIIIAKQSYIMMGIKSPSGGPLSLLAGIPWSFSSINPEIFIIGIVALILVLGWPKIPFKKVKALPATLAVLIAAISLTFFFDLSQVHAYSFAGKEFIIGPKYLISLPAQILNAFTFPDFSAITSATSIKYIIMFALVGSIESLLTVIAIDGIDPEKKRSDLNKDLLSVGVGNLIASLVGGLPMISEIVRSKANIDYGAKTKWSNFFHAVFLLVSIVAFPFLLQKIPLAALAALLVFTGLRLASPQEFKKIYKIGLDQFSLFTVTLIVTLLTDLLIGVATGFCLKILLHLLRGVKPWEFFKHESEIVENGKNTLVRLKGSLVFTNYLKVKSLVERAVSSGKTMTLDFSQCHFVDHTMLLKIFGLQSELGKERLSIVGLDLHKGSTRHPLSTKRLGKS